MTELLRENTQAIFQNTGKVRCHFLLFSFLQEMGSTFFLKPLLTFLRSVVITRDGVVIATETTGVVAMVFGDSELNIVCRVDADGEAKFLTPQSHIAQLETCKHRARSIWQREPVSHTHIHVHTHKRDPQTQRQKGTYRILTVSSQIWPLMQFLSFCLSIYHYNGFEIMRFRYERTFSFNLGG